MVSAERPVRLRLGPGFGVGLVAGGGAESVREQVGGGDGGRHDHGHAAATPTPTAIRRRTADRRGPALDVAQPERGRVHAVDLAVQLAAEQLFELVVGCSSLLLAGAGVQVWGARARRVASARLAWDFTVPTEMPSTSAVSASVSSS